MNGITHKFIGWMNDASYKYSGLVGNMDAKSPENASGWMNDGVPKIYSGMNDGVPRMYNGWMNDGSKKYALDGWWVDYSWFYN
jgi:hypothetical protein